MLKGALKELLITATHFYRGFIEDEKCEIFAENNIRIMSKGGNSIQIFLTPNINIEPVKKLTAKRKVPIKDAGVQKKKKKFERKPIPHDNLLSLGDYTYQTNSYFVQGKFIGELGNKNPLINQIMTNAYGYNETLGFIRDKLKKENSRIYLRKSLTRTQFTKNQSFFEEIYKPGMSFMKYQNSVGEGKSEAELRKILESGQDQNTEINNNGNFVCECCKRRDTKKYAKNLCQTCYKRQKRSTEGIEENGAESVLKINDRPEPLPIPSREWTGICPNCNK